MGVSKSQTCEDGYFKFGELIIDSLRFESVLNNRTRKIAILISDRTASGGEFLTVAFKFQENTKIFGTKTKGKTSHLRSFEFKSNAKLLLATDYYCDKDSVVLKNGIPPDLECSEEECLPKAIDWINNTI